MLWMNSPIIIIGLITISIYNTFVHPMPFQGNPFSLPLHYLLTFAFALLLSFGFLEDERWKMVNWE